MHWAFILVQARGEPRLVLGVHRLWNYVKLFWNSLDNALSSMVFYLEMKVEVKVGVHDIRSRFATRFTSYNECSDRQADIVSTQIGSRFTFEQNPKNAELLQ